MTSAHPDGGTRLSRGGEIVYRGLGVAAFAEQVVIQETGAVKIPADVPLEVACVIGCAVQTGRRRRAVHRRRGHRATPRSCSGSGGIGLSIVQGARLAGATTIIASDPVAERREAASRFGATHVIDPDGRRRRRDRGHGPHRGRGRRRLRRGGRARPWSRTGLDRHPHRRHHRHGRRAAAGPAARHRPADGVRGHGQAAARLPAGRRELAARHPAAHRPVPVRPARPRGPDHRPTARSTEINDAFDDLRASRGIRTVISL